MELPSSCPTTFPWNPFLCSCLFHLLIHQILIEPLLDAGTVLEAADVGVGTSKPLPLRPSILCACVCKRGIHSLIQ